MSVVLARFDSFFDCSRIKQGECEKNDNSKIRKLATFILPQASVGSSTPGCSNDVFSAIVFMILAPVDNEPSILTAMITDSGPRVI